MTTITLVRREIENAAKHELEHTIGMALHEVAINHRGNFAVSGSKAAMTSLINEPKLTMTTPEYDDECGLWFAEIIRIDA